MTEQYVYNGTVVVKTGRRAKKEDGAATRRTRTPSSDELYEVTPADKEDGTWKKWVRMNELYAIVTGDEDDTNET